MTSPIDSALLIQQITELQTICQQQNVVITQLNNEIAILKTQQALPSVSNKIPISGDVQQRTEYFTDEDELEIELAEVQSTKTQKKRKLDNTLTPPQTNKDTPQKQQSAEKKIPLPPPINISNIRDFNVLRNKVLNAVKKPTQFKALSNSDIKITTSDENDYRSVKRLLQALKEEEGNASNSPFYKLEYHTFQLKSERWYRFVIRGLPSSTSHHEIKTAVEEEGHEVASIINIYKKSTINGEKVIKYFPLFYVDILQKENNKEVFNIKELLHCKITIEPPKKARGIPQCTNCQQLGHTKNFCSRQARCVKCAGNHHTTQCRKQSGSAPTCALCNQKGHTANYRGCEVYQRKLKSQQPKNTTVVQRLQKIPVKKQEQVKPSTTGLSYAQVSKKSLDKQTKNKTQETVTNEPTLTDMMLLLSQFQTEIKQSISQLARRVDKLEHKSKPPNKQVKKKNNA